MSSFVEKNNKHANIIEKGVKLALNEPLVVDTRYQGQIEEFLQYNNGAGLKHIAFMCEDIIDTVEKITQTGKLYFLAISPTVCQSYYAKIWSLLL